jgi:hypothetical protein
MIESTAGDKENTCSEGIYSPKKLCNAQVIPMFMNRFLAVLGESSTPLSTGSFGGATTRS